MIKYKWDFIGFIAAFAIVYALSHMMFYGAGLPDVFWPLVLFAFAFGYGGGDWGILLGDFITTLIIFILLRVVLTRVWRMKGEQDFTLTLGLKMLGMLLLYLAIFPICFLIISYDF